MSGKRVVHCWTDKTHYMQETYGWASDQHIAAISEDVGSTCMLIEGHEGDHVWTPDDAIGVRFAPAPGDAVPPEGWVS